VASGPCREPDEGALPLGSESRSRPLIRFASLSLANRPLPARGERSKQSYSRDALHPSFVFSVIASQRAARVHARDALLPKVAGPMTSSAKQSSLLVHNLDCFVATAPRNDDHAKKIKGGGTPADALSLARTQAACGTRHEKRAACAAPRLRARSPAGVPRRFSPKGLSSRGLSFGPGFPKTAPYAADVPPTPPRSQRCTSRAGRIAGRHDARAARERTVSFRPRAPHSPRRQGVRRLPN
jgi:hypothetical protein